MTRCEYWEVLSPHSVYFSKEFACIFAFCFSRLKLLGIFWDAECSKWGLWGGGLKVYVEIVYVLFPLPITINLGGLSQDCVGGKITFMCVFGSFFMERKTHKQILRESRDNPVKCLFLCFFFCGLFRSQNPCPIRLDDRGAKHWK